MAAPAVRTRRRGASTLSGAGQPARLETWGPYPVTGLGLRRVRVYVPAGGAPQSVVVLFDGQNVFGDEGSFAGGWHAHVAAEQVATLKRPAPLVVGIDHGQGARMRELSPFSMRRLDGSLEALVAFMRDRLAPDLRQRFAIPQDPARWIVGGSSMGGLAALYTHFAIPEIFGGALSMSPSLWVAQRRIFPWVAAQSIPWTSRVYLDCGQREGRMMMHLSGSMAELLRQRGYGEDRLRWRPDARGSHNERSWRRRLPGALRFLL